MQNKQTSSVALWLNINIYACMYICANNKCKARDYALCAPVITVTRCTFVHNTGQLCANVTCNLQTVIIYIHTLVHFQLKLFVYIWKVLNVYLINTKIFIVHQSEW